MNNYKLVAPDIDSLLNCFERGFLNPSAPSEALCKAMDLLFEMLREMAPLRKNDEAKAIWVTIPRGSIEDFSSYEDMLEWGDVKNREEYEQYWLEEYPDPVCWYELVIAEAFHKDGSRWFRDGSGQFILATNRSSMRILIITMMRKPDSLTGRKQPLHSVLS